MERSKWMAVGRSRRCFKEPEADKTRPLLTENIGAAVAAVSKSLRRKSLGLWNSMVCWAAVAAVSKSLRRILLKFSGGTSCQPQSPLFQRA